MAEEREHYKYRMVAEVERLCLNKNLNFETKVTWKRNVNKAETRTVTHQDCESVFNQTLELELNLVYNHASSKFEPKMTEFTVVVIYQGKIKSGGHAKYDAADIVNNNYSNEPVRLNLMQCPDPDAYIDIVFNYEVVGECSRSLFNELSMLNPPGFEQDLSQIDFKEEEHHQSPQASPSKEGRGGTGDGEEVSLRERQLSKISNILDKFESVSRKLAASNHKSAFLDTTKNSSLEVSAIPTEQEERLKARVHELENELELKNAIVEDYEQKIENCNRRIEELELKLELSDERNREKEDEGRLDLVALAQSEQKYKQLYQQSLLELQELKEQLYSQTNFSKENNNFKKFVEEAHEIEEAPQFETERGQSSSQLNQKIDQLERENVELQTKIASTSHNIAQLFNAAFDYGGAKLLDYLQNSIGLIEQQS